jgi:cytochrome c-type biogenesis protein CcmH/NrfG
MAPGDADSCVELGLAYRATGRAADAVRMFRLAIELNPDSPESRGYLPGLIRSLEAE